MKRFESSRETRWRFVEFLLRNSYIDRKICRWRKHEEIETFGIWTYPNTRIHEIKIFSWTIQNIRYRFHIIEFLNSTYSSNSVAMANERVSRSRWSDIRILTLQAITRAWCNFRYTSPCHWSLVRCRWIQRNFDETPGRKIRAGPGDRRRSYRNDVRSNRPGRNDGSCEWHSISRR